MNFSYSGILRGLIQRHAFETPADVIAYCKNIYIRQDEYSDVFGFVFADHSTILIRKDNGKPF